MIKKTLHPGQLLRERCLEPLGLSVTEAANQIGISRQALNNILNEKAGISPGMAVRLAKFFGLRPETVQQWQKDYELGKARSGRARLDRARGESFSVNSGDLAAWADTIDARFAFPKLVRALVRATAVAGCTADFPAMEDAQNAGWDGLVESPVASAYVPAAKSAWELSTDAKPQSKAERDYQKRTENPLELEPAKTVLVLATLRKWPQKRQWMAAKNLDGIWAKVIVYDAVDFEQWLDLAPEPAIWLADRLGRSVTGVRSLDAFWNEFSLSTAPPITSSLLLAGRAGPAEKVGEWLDAGSGALRVLADSPDEALAFMAAVGITRATNSGNLLTNSIVVTDAEQARRLMGTSHRLTFGWQIDDPSLLGIIIDKGHRAFVPVSRSTGGAEHADLELPRLGRAEFIAAVKDALGSQDQLSTQQADPTARSIRSVRELASPQSALREMNDRRHEDEAKVRAKESGRSLTVYRRLYSAAGVSQPPQWATPEHAGELIPILLAGSWSESNEADRSALAALTGYEYTVVSRLLARLKNQSDSPVRQLGDTWTFVAPLDAWSLLAKFTTDIDLDTYQKIAVDILGESDPALTLDPNERWLASLHRKEFRHSDALRRGLAESLVFLASVADAAGLRASRGGGNRADQIVIELIGPGADSLRWASIYEQLPLLAEAAPEAFLLAVEDSLSAANQPVMKLFEIEKRPLGGGSRHPYLLWALEILAWYPDYLGRSARVLAKLAGRDPGGSLTNRPARSLRGIFCCWHPNTAASLDDRLKVIDSLLDHEPDVVWGLLLELLPKIHDVGETSAEPRWRALPERETTNTWGEIWRANEQIINRTLDQAGLRCDRLRQIVDRIDTWSPEQHSQFASRLREFARTSDVAEERLALWSELRDFVARSRTYKFMEESELRRFDEILNCLGPVDVLDRYCWLFDTDMPDLTQPKTNSSEETMEIDQRMAEVSEARREAAAIVMKHLGLDGLLSLAARAKLSYLVGQAAAETVEKGPVELDVMERALRAEDPKIRQAGMAFAWRRNEINGPDWSAAFLRSDVFQGWRIEMQADFCRTLPEGRATWRVLENLGRAVEERFWKETAVFLIRIQRDEDAEFAIEKLLEAGRAFDALDQAGSAPGRLSTGLLVRVLEAAIGALAKVEVVRRGMIDHDVERILQRLRASGEVSAGDLGRLEFQYLPLLQPLHTPVTLHKTLQSDPAFFADVVMHAFREDDMPNESPAGEAPQGDDIARNRARLAWDLLSKWSAVPGRREDGTIDAVRLKEWFHQARALNSANKRAKVGDIQIGRMLAYAPSGSDGIWPDESVRYLIDSTESRDLESGLRAGRINHRGVWTKLPSDGGRPERDLAKSYRADARVLALRWPRTAMVLNSLADIYDGFGKRDDITAEALDLLS